MTGLYVTIPRPYINAHSVFESFMRPEIQRTADEIKQAIDLLRRHL
ncbi:MAG TPA: hypothetical protein VID67_11065 [Rhizomicrobium sp.]